MNSGSTSCFPNVSQLYFGATEDVASSSLEASLRSDTRSSSLLYSLSVLREKIHQVQSLMGMLVSQDQTQTSESTALAAANMGSLLQEIILSASSMMFTCQQMSLGSTPPHINTDISQNRRVKPPENTDFSQPQVADIGEGTRQSFYCGETLEWYGQDSYNTSNTNDTNTQVGRRGLPRRIDRANNIEDSESLSPKDCDIIELDAAALLAKYTHYCHVCGKGFKRDANLRMHMRAHGDEYKSSAALINPAKNKGGDGSEDGSGSTKVARKYSCPQEGCRWNRKHAKFQPLKSMICVKNHYKRSHCPKMYVCKRCNRKQFSVLSDLRTHEKHCGDLRWQCSCGTTFSRKDKLMGHVALFVGHTPATSSLAKMAKVERNNQVQIRIENR
ncbi:hypothetical protein NMG60_11015619 [Bertholletia excelsa]